MTLQQYKLKDDLYILGATALRHFSDEDQLDGVKMDDHRFAAEKLKAKNIPLKPPSSRIKIYVSLQHKYKNKRPNLRFGLVSLYSSVMPKNRPAGRQVGYPALLLSLWE